MTRRSRLRRVGILCCHCLRNLAFYRAWHEAEKPFADTQFWVNLNGNFLDIAVLEWSKLFGDTRGKHHFGKVVSNALFYKAGLLASLQVTEDEFKQYIEQMRTYRDKFVAHLDDLNDMRFPSLSIAKDSTIYLYDYLLANESEGDTFHDAPVAAEPFYEQFLAQGKAEYAKVTQQPNPSLYGLPPTNKKLTDRNGG